MQYNTLKIYDMDTTQIFFITSIINLAIASYLYKLAKNKRIEVSEMLDDIFDAELDKELEELEKETFQKVADNNAIAADLKRQLEEMGFKNVQDVRVVNIQTGEEIQDINVLNSILEQSNKKFVKMYKNYSYDEFVDILDSIQTDEHSKEKFEGLKQVLTETNLIEKKKILEAYLKHNKIS